MIHVGVKNTLGSRSLVNSTPCVADPASEMRSHTQGPLVPPELTSFFAAVFYSFLVPFQGETNHRPGPFCCSPLDGTTAEWEQKLSVRSGSPQRRVLSATARCVVTSETQCTTNTHTHTHTHIHTHTCCDSGLNMWSRLQHVEYFKYLCRDSECHSNDQHVYVHIMHNFATNPQHPNEMCDASSHKTEKQYC